MRHDQRDTDDAGQAGQAADAQIELTNDQDQRSPPEMMATRAILFSTSKRLLAVGKTVGRKAEKTMIMPKRKSSVPYLPMKRKIVRWRRLSRPTNPAAGLLV